MDHEIKTFEIPEHRVDAFRERFAALVKRAHRIGCTAPGYSIGDGREVVTTETDLDGEPCVSVHTVFPVTVTGEAPRFAGWTFVAVVDYETGAPIFRRCSPGGDLDDRYRAMGPACEHCRLSRERKEVFVCHHEDGREVQVGRSCLKDFLGHESPEHIAAWAAIIAEAAESDTWGGGDEDGGGFVEAGLAEFLAQVARNIRLWGWMSRKAAGWSEEKSTAVAAWSAMMDARKASKTRDRATFDALRPTEQDRERAKASIAWARALGSDGQRLGDYLHNVKAACGIEVVSYKNSGIVASALPAYDRDLAARAEAKNEHLGKVKERLRDVLVRVTSVRALDGGAYGPRELIKCRDTEGRTIVWFTAAKNLGVGDEYLLTGTVKAHNVYRDMAETQVTNAELVAPGAPTRAEIRAAEKLSDAVREGAYAVTRWCPDAPDGFWRATEVRREDAVKAVDMAALTALRDELAGMLRAPGGDQEAKGEALAKLLPAKASRAKRAPKEVPLAA